MKNGPKPIDLTIDDTEALKQRIMDDTLSEADKTLLVGLINFNLWLRGQLAKAKLTIRKLKGLFGFRTEKKTVKNAKTKTTT